MRIHASQWIKKKLKSPFEEHSSKRNNLENAHATFAPLAINFKVGISIITLEWRINMPACLLIFKLFSRQHALILHSVFIHSNIFDQKYQKFMFFRLQYVHFWALVLVSSKFSRRHVYYFHKLFQQACLFRQARLFCTLEYAYETI